MKNQLLSLAVLLLLAGSVQAQHIKAAQVPSVAVAAFTKAYPGAKEVKWEKEGNRYEAGFEQGKTEMSVLLSAAGELEETETEMAPSALPAPIRAALAANYKGVKVSEAAKIVAVKTGEVTYETEVREKGKSRDVLFTADGREVAKK